MGYSVTSRQKQAIETKNRIFDTAIALIDKKGLSNVNIEEICKKANVSVGTFYYYYKSKNNVFYELYSRADDYFKHTVKDHLKQENHIDRIEEYFDYYARYNELTGIQTMQQMMNSENKNFIKKGRYMQKLLVEIIDEGQRKNEIKNDMSPEELCEYLFVIGRGLLLDWCFHDGKYNLRKKSAVYLKPIIEIFRKNT